MPISQSEGWHKLFDLFMRVLMFFVRFAGKMMAAKDKEKGCDQKEGQSQQ